MKRRDPALSSLERTRRDAAERERHEVAVVRTELARREAALAALKARALALEGKLLAAREAAAALSDVLGLRAAAQQLRALEAEREALSHTLGQAERAVSELRTALRGAQRAHLDTEVGLKAVSNLLGQRQRDAERRSELADEEALDELARARRF